MQKYAFADLMASWARPSTPPSAQSQCWLAGAVASSPEAQRTSLYLPPSLDQHFHIPSRSLTPPLSSPPLSAALVSLQPSFKSSVLHLLFHPYLSALLPPSLISFRAQWQKAKMKQNVMKLKMQKEIQLKCRKKMEMSGIVTQACELADRGRWFTCKEQRQPLDLYRLNFAEVFDWVFNADFLPQKVCWRQSNQN